MADGLKQFGLSQDGAFWVRLAAPIVAAALAISSEDGATAHHAERIALAKRVLQDPEEYARRFALPVATNAEVSAAGVAAKDSDLEFVVASVWDALALAEV